MGTEQTRRGFIQEETQAADAHTARSRARPAIKEAKRRPAEPFLADPVDWHGLLWKMKAAAGKGQGQRVFTYTAGHHLEAVMWMQGDLEVSSRQTHSDSVISVLGGYR